MKVSVIQRNIQVDFQLRVFFTRGVFAPANPLLRDILVADQADRTRGVLVVLDESLAQAQPELAPRPEMEFARQFDGRSHPRRRFQ